MYDNQLMAVCGLVPGLPVRIIQHKCMPEEAGFSRKTPKDNGIFQAVYLDKI